MPTGEDWTDKSLMARATSSPWTRSGAIGLPGLPDIFVPPDSSAVAVSLPDIRQSDALTRLFQGHLMTMPDERTRSLLWAGSFLVDIARDEALPVSIRRRAATIARHFPTVEDVTWLAESIRDSVLSIQLASPEQALPEQSDWDFEPLRHSTRFSWPEDP